LNTLLKFDGPRLDELLERVQAELGSDVTIVEANRTRRGGVAGFFAREWFEVIVDPGSAPARVAGPAGVAAAAEAPAAASEASSAAAEDPFLALAAAVDDVREPAEVDADARAFELALAGIQRAASLAEAPVETPRTPAATPSAEVVASAAPTEPMVPPPATTRLRDLELPLLLAHLDTMVPAHLLPATSAPTIAVVGDHHTVRGVAAALAVRLGLDDSDVIVASPNVDEELPVWLRLHSPEDVVARASRWRRSTSPRVIAVELDPGREGHAWAASMLEAIAADQVRLVAKAWQLTDQLAAKAAVLGGVDGLDLVEMSAAAQPELFLELDLPVLGIDGRPATSELWAALLYERRNDGDHR
jgi:hypothetical protein